MPKSRIALLLLLLPLLLRSQSPNLSWEHVNGPPCLTSQVLSFQGNLFAVTSCGLYKSSDNGDHWSGVTSLLTSNIQTAVVTPDALLVGVKNVQLYSLSTNQLEIYRSTDAGTTFSLVKTLSYGGSCDPNPHPVPVYQIDRLVPRNDSSLTISYSVYQYSCQFYYTKSVDKGLTWTTVGPFTCGSSNITPFPTYSQTLQAGDTILTFIGDTLYFPAQAPIGLPFYTDYEHPVREWNGALIFQLNFGIFQSTDNGRHWTYHAIPFGYHAIGLIDSFLYAGLPGTLYRTRDTSLQQWDTIWSADFSPSGTLVSIQKLPGGNLMLQDQYYMYRSDDNGLHWSTKWLGLGSESHRIFGADSLLIARNSANWFVSADDGNTWQFFSRQADSLALNTFEAVPGALLAVNANGIFRSENAGQTWALTQPVVIPNQSSQQFVRNGARLHIDRYYSDNAGISWLKIPNFSGYLLGATGDTVVTFSDTTLALRATRDNGLNWQENIYYPPFGIESGGFMQPLHYKGLYRNGRIIFVLNFTGYKPFSDDLGQSWSLPGAADSYKFQLSEVQMVGPLLFESAQGLFISADFGHSFSTPFPTQPSSYFGESGCYQYPARYYGQACRKGDYLFMAGKGVWRTAYCDLLYAVNGHPTHYDVYHSLFAGQFFSFHGHSFSTTGDHTFEEPDGNGCTIQYTVHLHPPVIVHSNIGSVVLPNPPTDSTPPPFQPKIYPNPATHQIHIRFPEPGYTWEMVNTYGQVVLRGYAPDLEETALLADLPGGMYRLKSVSPEGIIQSISFLLSR